MYSATFIWEPGEYDDEFHRLNDIIDDVAASLPGFVGVDGWQSADGKRRSAVYYWDSLDTLKTFSRLDIGSHLAFKRYVRGWMSSETSMVSAGTSRSSPWSRSSYWPRVLGAQATS